MNCTDSIRSLLNRYDINGHDRPGGTDKDTSHSYVEIYGDILYPFIDKYGSLLEIGVQYGGSSLLWQELLPNFRLCCVDNEDKIHQTILDKASPRTQFHFFDAYSKQSLDKIKNLHPGGFDVIIDDGPHTVESQKSCIELYLDLLKVNGVLIIEDIQNISYVDQLKQSIKESDFFDYDVTVFDNRETKGRYDDVVFVIRKIEKKPNTKIAIFYHVGQIGQWQRLYQEQLNSLCISGLYHAAEFIHIGVNGNQPLPSTLPKIKTVVNQNHVLEADTLKAMWDFCKHNPDYRVMYFHTKGATQESSKNRYNVDAWRLYLEYFVIHQWKKCLDKLVDHDCVGTEYSYETGLINQQTGETVWQINPHFAGNYWWANASYINKLDPNYLYNSDKGWTRYRSEFWIGTGNPNKYSFYQTTIFDKYSHSPYTPVDYIIRENFLDSKPATLPQGDTMLKNKRAKFVMITMFKNEAKTIGRMLESCYKYIDYYIIQDNGSTDGTPEVVENFFKDKNIPGFVYKVDEGWVGFGWNRDHLLQKCLNTDHGCDWILKMDCDEILSIEDGFDWSVFDDKTLHSFHVPAQNGSTIYNRAWIWNARLSWKFNHDTAHETIVLLNDNIGENFRRFDLPLSFKHIGFDDGESWQSKTKYLSDALKLEEKLIREDTMLSDMYHFWYVGKSYYDCFRETVYPLKTKHSNEFARRCIFNFKEFLNITHNYEVTNKADRIDEMGYYAMMCIGNSYHFIGDIENAIKYLKASEEFCPPRNEHLTCLAEVYKHSKQYNKMLEVTTRAVSPNRKNPFPSFTFIIETQCYPDTGSYVHELHKIALENANSEQYVNISNLSVRDSSNTRLWVVDNFYSNPDKVREFALSVNYKDDKDWYKGIRSSEQYNFPGIQQAFEKIMNRKLKNLNTHGMCGRFQVCTAQEDLVYHVDGQQWAAVIFLSPNAPIETGTCLLRSRLTGARHSDDPFINQSFDGGFYDKTKFDVVDVVGNVYNRVVIFDAKCIHAASQYFGTNKNDSRLTHLFFFEDE